MANAFYRQAGIMLPLIKGVGRMHLPLESESDYQSGFFITKRPYAFTPGFLSGIENRIYSDLSTRIYGPRVKLVASLNYIISRTLRIGHEAEVEGMKGFTHNSMHGGQYGLIPNNLKSSDSPAGFLGDMECAEWGERAILPLKILDMMEQSARFFKESYDSLVKKPEGLRRWEEIAIYTILGYENVTDVDEFAEKAFRLKHIIDDFIGHGENPVASVISCMEDMMLDIWGMSGHEVVHNIHSNRKFPDENGVVNSIDVEAVNARHEQKNATVASNHMSPKPDELAKPVHASRKRHKSKRDHIY